MEARSLRRPVGVGAGRQGRSGGFCVPAGLPRGPPQRSGKMASG